jgi:hypothetical protein
MEETIRVGLRALAPVEIGEIPPRAAVILHGPLSRQVDAAVRVARTRLSRRKWAAWTGRHGVDQNPVVMTRRSWAGAAPDSEWRRREVVYNRVDPDGTKEVPS